MSTQHAIKKHAFGTTGMQVGAIGFGAAEIGFERATDRTVDALLGAALDDRAAVRGLAVAQEILKDEAARLQLPRPVFGKEGSWRPTIG
jgi:hypothetical protein